MSRDKQIEEIKAIILEDCGGDCENCEFHNKAVCYDNFIANRLYNKGYRKASDVAREIFEEIEKLTYSKCFSVRADRDVTGLIIDGEKFAELRKKHLGEDINAPTKESEGI